MNDLGEKKLQSNIWKFYLFDIFGAMLFAVPIIVLFWQENGLSLTQIMILQSLFSIAMVILEIPTGYLADIYGRKNILLLSAISFLVAVWSAPLFVDIKLSSYLTFCFRILQVARSQYLNAIFSCCTPPQ